MISTDWRIAVLGSREHARMGRYSSIADELHIIVFSRLEQGLSPSTTDNLFIYPTNSANRWFYGLDAMAISRRLKKSGITLVTAQDPFETGLAAYRIARKLKASLQLQLHTDWLSPFYAAESLKNKIRVRILNFLVPRASCIRVVSERLKAGLMSRFNLSKEPTVLPIHHDIPAGLLAERGDLLRKKYPQFGFIIVMVCRLEPEKNTFLALNAFKNIIGNHRGVGFVIVGDGSVRPVLERAVGALELEDKVIFDGWHDNAIPYFGSADLFINSSNYEGYGRTLIEAAASGCPVLTTDVGVVGEIFTSENALIVPPGDLERFQEKLDYALKHPEILQGLAARARLAVSSHIAVTEDERLKTLKESWEFCGK